MASNKRNDCVPSDTEETPDTARNSPDTAPVTLPTNQDIRPNPIENPSSRESLAGPSNMNTVTSADNTNIIRTSIRRKSFPKASTRETGCRLGRSRSQSAPNNPTIPNTPNTSPKAVCGTLKTGELVVFPDDNETSIPNISNSTEESPSEVSPGEVSESRTPLTSFLETSFDDMDSPLTTVDGVETSGEASGSGPAHNPAYLRELRSVLASRNSQTELDVNDALEVVIRSEPVIFDEERRRSSLPESDGYRRSSMMRPFPAYCSMEGLTILTPSDLLPPVPDVTNIERPLSQTRHRIESVDDGPPEDLERGNYAPDSNVNQSVTNNDNQSGISRFFGAIRRFFERFCRFHRR